jgi:glyoxylase-like metal-dependent hydrolase (beta-lactamase superfamily II)
MPRTEQIADGVTLLRGRAPGRLQRLTNVYLIENDGKVTVFDSGSSNFTRWIRDAAADRGEIEQVLLSHAHADHRGGAGGLGAPVLCGVEERGDVEGDGGEHTFDYSKVRNPLVRALAPGTVKRMDGGPLAVAGTVCEGDTIAGFQVLELAGHSPGLVGLWRESDRVALVSDAVFVFNPFTVLGLPGDAKMPPPPGRPFPDKARASIRKIAALDPALVGIGHWGPLTGDVRAQLERAAESD